MDLIRSFFGRPVVKSTLRHAALSAIGVFSAAVAVGGFPAVTVAVVAAAAAAAARVVIAAVTAALADPASA